MRSRRPILSRNLNNTLLRLSDARDLKSKSGKRGPLERAEFMHPFSVLTLGIFVAGYITARWDLVTRLYELAIFAWDHGVVVCVQAETSSRLGLTKE